MNQAEITKGFQKDVVGLSWKYWSKGGHENLRIAFHYGVHFAPSSGLRLAIARQAAQYCLYHKHIPGFPSLHRYGSSGGRRYNRGAGMKKQTNKQTKKQPSATFTRQFLGTQWDSEPHSAASEAESTELKIIHLTNAWVCIIVVNDMLNTIYATSSQAGSRAEE